MQVCSFRGNTPLDPIAVGFGIAICMKSPGGHTVSSISFTPSDQPVRLLRIDASAFKVLWSRQLSTRAS